MLQFILFYSDNGKQDPLFITNYVTINILDVLSRINGVGQASLFSKLNYAMRIWFDTTRLQALNLQPSDVLAAINAQNVQAPVGRIGARPISNDQQFQLNVQTQGRLTTPEQFGNIVLRANPDGSVLKVRDVARVEMGAQNDDSLARLDGKPAVALATYLSPGANAVATAAAVNKALEGLRGRFPEGLKSQVVYDTTTFVSDTIHEVLKTLGEAFVLVVIVVFLFLGNLRATLIPTIAVPVSLIGAFAVLLAAGFSANTVSLLAMVLAIGIVVDDAIVVVENVERVMEEEPDLSPADATKKAMAQITGPIIAISLVLLSVFVPIAFIPGVSGQLFRQFAVTISAAMIISALNALTLSPALCAVFLRAPPHGRRPRHHGPRRCAASTMCATAMPASCIGCSAWSILAILLVGVFAAGIYGLSLRVPSGFLPEEDQGAFFIADAAARRRLGLAQRGGGPSRSRTSSARCHSVQGVLSPSLASRCSTARQRAECNAFIVVKPETLRRPHQLPAILGDTRLIRRGCSAPRSRSDTAFVFPFNLPPIIGLSTSGGFEYQLDERWKATGSGRYGQRDAGGLLVGRQPGPAADARVLHLSPPPTHRSIWISTAKRRRRSGLNLISDVFTALQATLGGIYVNDFNLFGRTWQVLIEGEPVDRVDISSIWKIYVRSSSAARWCRCARSLPRGSWSGRR